MMHLNITTIQRANVGKLMYFTDVFRTMLHWRWYWIALVVTMMYMIQFTIFAAIYYLLGSYRVINTANDDCSNRQCDCMPDITTFEEAFFFSVQTQITIGYGDMVPNPRCSLAILFIIIQSLVGLTADAMLFGLVYQRYVLARSLSLSLVTCLTAYYVAFHGLRKMHHTFASAMWQRLELAMASNTLCSDWQTCAAHKSSIPRSRFSQQASVSQWYASHSLTRACALAHCVDYPCQQEGEQVYSFKRLKLEDARDLFLALPVVVAHLIDESSPFYNLNYDAAARADLQVIVMLDGIEASTSGMLHATLCNANSHIHIHSLTLTLSVVRPNPSTPYVHYKRNTVPAPVRKDGRAAQWHDAGRFPQAQQHCTNT
jgi:hypothetical protein